MPRVCTVCTHQEKEAIDRALATGSASKRKIASIYGVSESSLRRHEKNHMPAVPVKVQDAAEITYGDELIDQVQQLSRWAKAIVGQASKAKDLRTALAGIREARGCLELLAKLTDKLQQEGTVNVLIMPQWIEVRAIVVAALAPYPEAREAVTKALAEVGHVGD